MCNACMTMTRRKFFSRAAATGLAAGMLAKSDALEAGQSITAEEALARLKIGNRKFMKSPKLCEDDMVNNRKFVAKSQSPWAAVLACADSRVCPELIFGGMQLGELFVCRNAGNVADIATLGSIEYSVEHLRTPLILVLGHERCGAVAAACDVAGKHLTLPGFIRPMVDAIVPTAKDLLGEPGDFVDNVVRENAKRMASRIATESSIVQEKVHEGKVKVAFGRYDLDSGCVEFLGWS